ncbi:hypothetical protein BX600DRAFT_476988 [Xylariales sp. PMI_506]|nr:hypothetical protein BX600DRAFT_476988 [Xylariales sp. PMI_506]
MWFFNRSVAFNASTDIPPLDGKVILVTGGNTGLGEYCVRVLSRHNPAQIWLAARNLAKAQLVVDEVKKEVPGLDIRILELDLSSLAAVKVAAAAFAAQVSQLHFLMLNAGVMSGTPSVTQDGYENQMGVNHLGHALFTKLLLPVLQRTAASPGVSPLDVRVVSLSSSLHRYGGIRYDLARVPSSGWFGFIGRYGQSKVANILWAKELARRHPELTVVSVHPGVVATELGMSREQRSVFSTLARRAFELTIVSVEEGAKNQLWALVSPDVRSGEYYEPVGIAGTGSAESQDEKAARELWDWTERELVPYTTQE